MKTPRSAASRAIALLALAFVSGCTRNSPAVTAPGDVTVSPRTAEVATGGTVQYSATVTGAQTAQVTWTVQEAGGGTVDPTGLYGAPGTPGTFHVVATSVADPSKAGTGTVTVVAVSSLSISPNPASVAVGGTQQFVVTPAVAVNWSVTQSGGAPPAPAPVFPLKISANGHYFVDQNDHPFRIQAEAAWFLSAVATPAMVASYLDDRKAKGFNSIYVMAMVHPGGYSVVPNAPNNYAGDPPFSTPGLFSTAGADAASQRYWAHIDYIVDQAASRDMVVMLAFTYLGYSGGSQGWWQDLLAQPSRQACFDWGVWLGNRYKSKTNVIWFTCGDFTPPAGSEGEAREIAIINGIKSVAGASKLFMTEMNSPNSVPTLESAAIGALLDMNSFYGYGASGTGNSVVEANRAYHYSPAKPAFVQEPGYEGENNTGSFPSDTAYGTRRSRFWSVLAGGTAGDGFGTARISSNIGAFSPWPACLSSPAAAYSSHAFQLFASLPWWDLVPCGGANDATSLITSGGGTFGASDTSYIASSITSDRSWALAYVPGTNQGTASRTFTVDMAALSGAARARWWNPTTGGDTTIGTYANAGTQSFTTPGSNGAGNDWILVLDATAGGSCGTISSSGLYTAPSVVPAGVTCRVRATMQSDPNVEAFATVNLH
jgi:hypothetical protein